MSPSSRSMILLISRYLDQAATARSLHHRAALSPHVGRRAGAHAGAARRATPAREHHGPPRPVAGGDAPFPPLAISPAWPIPGFVLLAIARTAALRATDSRPNIFRRRPTVEVLVVQFPQLPIVPGFPLTPARRETPRP